MEIYGHKIKFHSFILETSLIPKRRAPLCALTSWTLPFRIPLIKQQFSDVARWFYFLRIAAEFVCVTNERYVRLLVRKCARFCFVCHDTSFKKWSFNFLSSFFHTAAWKPSKQNSFCRGNKATLLSFYFISGILCEVCTHIATNINKVSWSVIPGECNGIIEQDGV